MSSDLPSIDAGSYRHNKTGRIYEVLGVALHTETDEPMVVYYKSQSGALYVRPSVMFVESVCLDGVWRPRFERIADDIMGK